MLVKVKSMEDKSLIYKNLTKLKQVNKEHAKPYFITDQLPESWAEKRRFNYGKMQNQKLPDAQKATTTLNKGILNLDGVPYNPPIKVKSVNELCHISTERKQMLHNLQFIEGSTETQDHNIFAGFVAEVYSSQQAQNFYDAMHLLHPNATHIMCTYRLTGINLASSFEAIDDREYGSLRVFLSLLDKGKHINKALFVTRHYEGKHISVQLMKKVAQATLGKLCRKQCLAKQLLMECQLQDLNNTI